MPDPQATKPLEKSKSIVLGMRSRGISGGSSKSNVLSSSPASSTSTSTSPPISSKILDRNNDGKGEIPSDKESQDLASDSEKGKKDGHWNKDLDDDDVKMSITIDEGVSSESDSDDDLPFFIGSSSSRRCTFLFNFVEMCVLG